MNKHKKVLALITLSSVPSIASASSHEAFYFLGTILPLFVKFIFAMSFVLFIIFLIKKKKAEKGSEKRRKYRKKSIASLIIFISIFGFWFLIGIVQSTLGVGSGGRSENYIPSVLGGGIRYDSRNTANNFKNSVNGTINDTREFLKTSYNSTFKSRNVMSDTEYISDTIKALDGRVDSLSSSSNYGNISFVLPKSNLSDFRNRIKNRFPEKLRNEKISQKNKLSNKQNLESNKERFINELSKSGNTINLLEKEYIRKKSEHKKDLSRLNAQISASRKKLDTYNFNNTEDANVIDAITDDINNLEYRKRNLIENYNNYVSDFDEEYFSEEDSIENSVNSIENNDVKEAEFFSDIETVNGQISINYISFWKKIELYSPIKFDMLVFLLGLFGFILIIRLAIKS